MKDDGSAKTTRKSKLPEYIAGVIINSILLFVVNKVPSWNLSFITENFSDLLWVLTLSLGVQVFFNFILIFYHTLFFHNLINLVFNIVSIFALAGVYYVFPFDFSQTTVGWLGTFARVIILIAIVATAISGFVHVFRLLFLSFKPREEKSG